MENSWNYADQRTLTSMLFHKGNSLCFHVNHITQIFYTSWAVVLFPPVVEMLASFYLLWSIVIQLFFLWVRIIFIRYNKHTALHGLFNHFTNLCGVTATPHYHKHQGNAATFYILTPKFEKWETKQNEQMTTKSPVIQDNPNTSWCTNKKHIVQQKWLMWWYSLWVGIRNRSIKNPFLFVFFFFFLLALMFPVTF